MKLLPTLFLLSFLFSACLTTTTTLPSFSFSSLESSGPSLLNALLKNGGVVINNVPGYAEARKAMLQEPLSFNPTDPKESFQSDEDTGLNRLTVSSMVWGGKKEEGGMGELGGLREVVDRAVQVFLESLGNAVSPSLAGVVYANGYVGSVKDLGKGEGIEHYHYYTKPLDGKPTHTNIMDVHRDAGCFIAMTVGGSSSSSSPDPLTLSILTPTGDLVPLSSSPDSLIIFVGAGMSKFLKTSLPFHALPHSLSLENENFENFVDRGWYGRMYFPPKEAVVEKEGVLFAKAFEELGHDTTNLKSNGIRGQSNGCGENEIYCWKQCTDASELPCDANSALCYDTGSEEVITYPDSMNDMCPSGMMNCVLVCPETLNGVGTADTSNNGNTDTDTDSGDGDDDLFCKGSGTTMFMDGFHFVLAGNAPCVNFFFVPATMDTWWKFLFGVIGQFFLAFGTEFMSMIRRKTYEDYKNSTEGRRTVLLVPLVALYCFQVLVGYLIMLGAMTYSIEILFAVVLGLGVGYVVFNRESPPPKKAEPCCVEDYNNLQ